MFLPRFVYRCLRCCIWRFGRLCCPSSSLCCSSKRVGQI